MTEELKNAPKKLSLQRRTKTTVSGTSASGKSKEVQVEVRKKRTIPTEAAQRSGTQRTIDFALDLGNSVFCLPGRFGDKMSWSMNEYIKEGAILVNKLEDFGGELGF